MSKIAHENGEATYELHKVAAFRKTKEQFGGLSNMASGYPLQVNGVKILTSEALYQACRFPHMPEVQEEIIAQKSPMTAKMKSKPHRKNSREDFEKVKVQIMRWCLQVKLAQNFNKFAALLENTGELDIVENSHKDKFWGAVPSKYNEELLTGKNFLGRLLKQLRGKYYKNKFSNLYELLHVPPLEIDNFLLFGEPIRAVDEREAFLEALAKSLKLADSETEVQVPKKKVNGNGGKQEALFT